MLILLNHVTYAFKLISQKRGLIIIDLLLGFFNIFNSLAQLTTMVKYYGSQAIIEVKLCKFLGAPLSTDPNYLISDVLDECQELL